MEERKKICLTIRVCTYYDPSIPSLLPPRRHDVYLSHLQSSSRRIHRREAITRNLPLSSILLEDEQLLVRFQTTSSGFGYRAACRSPACKGPVWSGRDDFKDVELDVKGNGREDPIVCLTNSIRADGRRKMLGHEDAVLCIKPNHNQKDVF